MWPSGFFKRHRVFRGVYFVVEKAAPPCVHASMRSMLPFATRGAAAGVSPGSPPQHLAPMLTARNVRHLIFEKSSFTADEDREELEPIYAKTGIDLREELINQMKPEQIPQTGLRNRFDETDSTKPIRRNRFGDNRSANRSAPPGLLTPDDKAYPEDFGTRGELRA